MRYVWHPIKTFPVFPKNHAATTKVVLRCSVMYRTKETQAVGGFVKTCDARHRRKIEPISFARKDFNSHTHCRDASFLSRKHT